MSFFLCFICNVTPSQTTNDNGRLHLRYVSIWQKHGNIAIASETNRV